jgi:hypothetical protein
VCEFQLRIWSALTDLPASSGYNASWVCSILWMSSSTVCFADTPAVTQRTQHEVLMIGFCKH